MLRERSGDTTVRVVTTADAVGSIDCTIDISGGQFDAARAIYTPGQISFQIQAKKRGVKSSAAVELNITLLIEQL